MSDDEDFPSVFSKRGKAPVKTPEQLKAAEELVKKLQAENLHAEDTKPLGKRGRKKKFHQAARNGTDFCFGYDGIISQPGTSSKSSDAVHEESFEREIEKTRLSAAAKRRLKKMKVDQEKELMEIENENRKILEAPIQVSEVTEDPGEISEDDNIQKYHLRVSYQSRIEKYQLHENEKFSKLFKNVAKSFELLPTEFLLCLQDRNISAADTPKSLGLSEYTYIEVIPYKSEGKSEYYFDEDNLTLTFQSNDSKSKIEMVVNKNESMYGIMERYAFKRSMPLSMFQFEFDGEILGQLDTPLNLDLEEGCCIDVRVYMPLPGCSQTKNDNMKNDENTKSSDKNASTSCESCASEKKVHQSKKDYFDEYFRDFVFAESDSDSDVIPLN